MTVTIDLFHNVHKGIRRALFDATVALGRDDEGARALLRNALHFTAHHGENEDVLLLPLLAIRLPSIAERMRRAHDTVDHELHRLREDIDDAPLAHLYARACMFTSRYLEHIDEEEAVIDPAIRAAYASDELEFFGVQSVARTRPDDARMMLRLMLPSLPRVVADGYLAKLPADLVS